ncbi:hypothetical protein JVT61DRAFT_12218 [Boletus reticuloceps]|uniref:Uncharacterized protein n=1 Tax=Boletus reticuloceps TaxID=495285 RepID=A0A8I2YEC2_9AGAM|nr:hypothetical protein JVT61DRAFT_12218 [Boletus reticuloceps]
MAPVKRGWLPKSKCPDLFADASARRKVPLAHFFNTVLQCVKVASGLNCLKNSNSSTIPLKGYGLDSKRKPDIALFKRKGDTWPHLVSFCEVKNKADASTERDSYIKVAGKSACLLFMQDSCHVAPSIHILGS